MGVGRISLWISNGLWPETDGQWKCASFGTKRINTLKIITGRNRRQCNDCGTMINCRSNVSHFQLCQDIKKKQKPSHNRMTSIRVKLSQAVWCSDKWQQNSIRKSDQETARDPTISTPDQPRSAAAYHANCPRLANHRGSIFHLLIK